MPEIYANLDVKQPESEQSNVFENKKKVHAKKWFGGDQKFHIAHA